MAANKPILSKQAFWDVDMEKIDYKKHATFVIEKIFDRGNFDDLLAVLNFYNEGFIKETLMNRRYLMNDTTAFACVLFDLKKEDFRCYRYKQSNPYAWPF